MSENPESEHEVEIILPGSPPSPPRPPRPHRHAPSLFWPMALIGLGVVLLLSNMGLIPATGWAVLWRLWPIGLIALGLDVLIGRRSVAAAIASGVLILVLIGTAIGVVVFAEQIPVLVDLAKAPGLKTEHVATSRDGIESADIFIDYTSMPCELDALSDSGNLIEGYVAYYGDLTFSTQVTGEHANVTLDSYYTGLSYGPGPISGEDARWDVAVSPDVELALDLDAGSGRCDFRLAELALSELIIDAGSGGIDLALPQTSSFSGEIDGGSGSMTIDVPEGVGLRIDLEDGSGSFHPGDRLRLVSGDLDDDSVWETDGYDNADYQVELFVDQGSGSLRIK